MVCVQGCSPDLGTSEETLSNQDDGHFLLQDSGSPNGSLSATLNIVRVILPQARSPHCFLLKALQWPPAPLERKPMWSDYRSHGLAGKSKGFSLSRLDIEISMNVQLAASRTQRNVTNML